MVWVPLSKCVFTIPLPVDSGDDLDNDSGEEFNRAFQSVRFYIRSSEEKTTSSSGWSIVILPNLLCSHVMCDFISV